MTTNEEFLSWGRCPKLAPATSARPPFAADTLLRPRSLPVGNRRSYGDSCQISGGHVLDMRGLNRFLAFDRAAGRLRCGAGVLLCDVLDLIVPQGWFLQSTPGTALATVGGCIANDVHGKNHHVVGTFGDSVEEFWLLRSDRGVLRCARDENADLFAATIGGIGLTGVILEATIRLRPVANAFVEAETIPFGSLDEFFALDAESQGSEYSVSWIDVLASGRALGRGHYMRGEHAGHVPPRRVGRGLPLSFPCVPPLSCVNPWTLRAFNTAYWHRIRRPTRATTHYAPFFHPLDGIGAWNRMYGPRGFRQYQCVIPRAAAPAVVGEILQETARTGEGSFLVVLKTFGDRPAPGMLSFPRGGVTIAMDFPETGPGLLSLLDRFDDAVAEAGGAVYAAKDSRMSKRSFARFYPQAEAFSAFVDPSIVSSFWERVKP